MQPVKIAMLSHYPFKTLPKFESTGAAAIDLPLAILEDYTIQPGEVFKAPSGIKMAIPEGFVGLIYPRGSSVNTRIMVANGTGVIDSDYRGEITIPLWNTGMKYRHLKSGEKYAQMVFTRAFTPKLEAVKESMLGKTDRGEGAFGSTGGYADLAEMALGESEVYYDKTDPKLFLDICQSLLDESELCNVPRDMANRLVELSGTGMKKHTANPVTFDRQSMLYLINSAKKHVK